MEAVEWNKNVLCFDEIKGAQVCSDVRFILAAQLLSVTTIVVGVLQLDAPFTESLNDFSACNVIWDEIRVQGINT